MISIGIDIVEIDRLRRIIARGGSSFLKRVFSKNEIVSARKLKDSAEYFARLFTLKESLVKANGYGFMKIMPNEIDIRLTGRVSLLDDCFAGNIKAYLKGKKVDIVYAGFIKFRDSIICNLIIDR